MKLVKYIDSIYSPDTDTLLQVKGSGLIYFTKDNTKAKNEWQTIKFEDRILIPVGSTYYFFCAYDNILAEIEV